MPVLGHLFSNHNGDHKKTEIVLQITPHIIRPQLAADADTQELWSGTDSNVHTEQLRLDPPSVEASGAPPTVIAPAERVTPGNVGGGTVGGDAKTAGVSASAPVTAAPRGSFGQPAAAPRTTPPPAPFGGRFSTTAPLPGSVTTAPAAAAAEAAPAAAATATPSATTTAVPTPAPTPATAPTTAPATAPTTAPAPTPAMPPAPAPAPPPSILPTPPSDVPTDNPLHPIPTGTY